MLTLESLYKTYTNASESIPVLKNIHLHIPSGKFATIMGPSGSGKSTVLGIAAGLDRPDSGKVVLDGVDLTQLTEDELAGLRGSKIGFVFQNFQLVPSLTALENVGLPLVVSSSLKDKEIRKLALEVLAKVGLENRANHFPSQLSGGEEQRVAIARSFINNPKILFADEPTANLDSKNSEKIMTLLKELNQQFGSTLVVVTHDPDVAQMADMVFLMKDGEIDAKTSYTKPTKPRPKKAPSKPTKPTKKSSKTKAKK